MSKEGGAGGVTGLKKCPEKKSFFNPSLRRQRFRQELYHSDFSFGLSKIKFFNDGNQPTDRQGEYRKEGGRGLQGRQ